MPASKPGSAENLDQQCGNELDQSSRQKCPGKSSAVPTAERNPEEGEEKEKWRGGGGHGKKLCVGGNAPVWKENTNMRQKKCTHIANWHPTEKRMLRLSAKTNMTVKRKEEGETPLWRCPMCEEGLFIYPRSRTGRNARAFHGTRQHLGTAVFKLTSTSQIARMNGEKGNIVVPERSWMFSEERKAKKRMGAK